VLVDVRMECCMEDGSVSLHVSLYVGSRNDSWMEANFASSTQTTFKL
jgi:hypothetical protein